VTSRHRLGAAMIALTLAAGGPAAAASAGAAEPPAAPGHSDLRATVMAAERAFAATLANRDHAAFTAMIDDEAVFFDGTVPLRGRAAVAAAWAGYFEGPDAPFSWAPDQAEVLASGTLALTTGPVFDAGGNVIARFQSIWRREPSGAWRVVFDRGHPVCDPTSRPNPPGGG